MDEDPASLNVGFLEKRSNQPKYKEPKRRSPKTTAKLIQNNVYCFSKQYFGWPYQPSLQMLLNLCKNHNIIWMENVAIKIVLKGRGGNDLQNKSKKEKK